MNGAALAIVNNANEQPSDSIRTINETQSVPLIMYAYKTKTTTTKKNSSVRERREQQVAADDADVSGVLNAHLIQSLDLLCTCRGE
jgi:hypothetical protein